MTRKRKITVSTVVIHIILIFAAIICLLPVINVIALSFSGSAIATAGKVSFWPKNFSLGAYQEIMRTDTYFRSFGISIVRVVLQLAISLPILVMMAFAMSRSDKEFKGRNVIMWYAIFTMLFGGGLIPTYMVIKNLGLLDTIWVLVIPGAMSTGNMIVTMNFFRGIPKELDEAAEIDGAGAWYTLLKIYLPLSLPVLATMTLFIAVGTWNEFFSGMVYITNTELMPLQTYIRSLTVNVDYTSMSREEIDRLEKIAGITFNSAKVVVAMVPVMIIYPFLQKYFVSGLVVGAVKG